MNNFTLLPPKIKIRKCPSYFSGFSITLEWHLCKYYRNLCKFVTFYSVTDIFIDFIILFIQCTSTLEIVQGTCFVIDIDSMKCNPSYTAKMKKTKPCIIVQNGNTLGNTLT